MVAVALRFALMNSFPHISFDGVAVAFRLAPHALLCSIMFSWVAVAQGSLPRPLRCVFTTTRSYIGAFVEASKEGLGHMGYLRACCVAVALTTF